MLFCATSAMKKNQITSPSSAPDEGLIAQIAAGSTEALASLYRQTNSSVYGFALSIVKNSADAEDIMQETYLRICSCAGGYSPQGKPMAWILTIVKNLALMKLRSQKPVSPLEDWDPPDGRDHFRASEDRIVLAAALRYLSDDERQILILHAVSGLKQREIASLLELKLTTVLSKYRRALKKLKSHLMEGERC